MSTGAKRQLNSARAALKAVAEDYFGRNTPDQIARAKAALKCLGPKRKDELTLKQVMDAWSTCQP